MGQVEDGVKAFRRIVRWLEAHKKGKAVLPSLRPPATAKAIGEFEAKAKLKLPAALMAIYRLHDGQDEDAANDALDGETVESGLFPSIEGRDDLPFLLVPLKELARGIKGGMPGFRKGWLPFGDNYGGDHMVIDLASSDPKKRGRVLQFNHEYGAAVEVAPSFEKYLAHIADGLETKKIDWDEDSGLAYKRGRDWDDLIEKKKVESEAPEPEKPTRAAPLKSVAKKSAGGRVDPELIGKWEVIDCKFPARSFSAIIAYKGGTAEFTAGGEFIVRPPKGGLGIPQKHRYVCARNHQPPWIDLSDRKFRDMRSLAIYQITGDELLLCISELREPRPPSPSRAKIVQRMKRL